MKGRVHKGAFKYYAILLGGGGGHQKDHKRSQGGEGGSTKRSQRITITGGGGNNLATLKVLKHKIFSPRIYQLSRGGSRGDIFIIMELQSTSLILQCFKGF